MTPLYDRLSEPFNISWHVKCRTAGTRVFFLGGGGRRMASVLHLTLPFIKTSKNFEGNQKTSYWAFSIYQEIPEIPVGM